MQSCQILVILGQSDTKKLRGKLQPVGKDIIFKMTWKSTALIIQTVDPLAPLQAKMCELDILM